VRYIAKERFKKYGRCCDQVVSVLAFSSNDLSSNPAEAYSFFVQFVFDRNEKTRPGLVHLKKDLKARQNFPTIPELRFLEKIRCLI